MRSVCVLLTWATIKLPFRMVWIYVVDTAAAALAVRGTSRIVDVSEHVGKFTEVVVALGCSVSAPTLLERPSASSLIVETMA